MLSSVSALCAGFDGMRFRNSGRKRCARSVGDQGAVINDGSASEGGQGGFGLAG